MRTPLTGECPFFMDNSKRFLITTADERSWEFDRPVLFLGEWCRRYDRKSIWSKMDAIVAAPYGVSSEERDRDFLFGQEMKAELLIILADSLNRHHKTKHSRRYWQILLGHWLYRYVDVILNRWSTLKQAFGKYNITETVVFDLEKYSLATYDALSFIFATGDDLWNHVLYSKLLKSVKKEFTIRFRKIEDEPYFALPYILERDGNKDEKTLGGIISNVLESKYRNTNAFFLNTYLPKKSIFNLQLVMGQVPQLVWWRPPCRFPERDIQIRESLRLNTDGYRGIKKAICLHLFDMLPTCYLEGYMGLANKAKTLPWPNTPRFIFTSSSFDTDEVFKAWAGDKVEQGVPYYLGQHGNSYGTEKYCRTEIECLATAEKFITWGWQDNNAKCVPAFLFKTLGRKSRKYDKNGGLLLVELPISQRMNSWDNWFVQSLYQRDQFLFVSKLGSEIQGRVTVRLKSSFQQASWCDDQRWRDQFPSIVVEKGDLNIHKLISDSRIVVHTYNSTGMLETLALNIPTICFWDHNVSPIRDSAAAYYQQLRDVGILHDSPGSAATMISRIWDGVDDWWSSNKVQNSCEIFCGKYAREVKNPIRTIKKLLCNEKN